MLRSSCDPSQSLTPPRRGNCCPERCRGGTVVHQSKLMRVEETPKSRRTVVHQPKVFRPRNPETVPPPGKTEVFRTDPDHFSGRGAAPCR